MDQTMSRELSVSLPTTRQRPHPQSSTRTARLLSLGGLMAALGVASCCVVPFVLLMLGISGAWIGNLTALEPYQPIFAAAAIGLIGRGFYLVYRRPGVEAACAEGSACATQRSSRMTKVGLWTATILVVIGLGFPKLAPLFL